MERYEAYKDSGVEWIGEIPEGWSVRRFKHLLRIIGGNGFPPDAQGCESGDYPFCKVSDINGDGWTVASAANYVDAQWVEESRINIIPAGSILMAKVGAALAKNHRKVSLCDCCIDNNMQALVPATQLIELKYLYWVMRTVNMSWYDAGGTLPYVDNQRFLNDRTPYPDKEAQRRIADYLDTKTAEIDALVADCEREIGLLQEYRKAVISEAVTKGLDPDAPMKDSGIEWIGEIPERWLATPLKHIVISIESGTSLDGASWPASENEKGVLTLSAVYQSRFDAIQNKAVSPELYERLSCPLRSGTLLISRCNTSEWVGTAAYVSDAPDNLFLPDKLWQLSFASDYVCRFIQYALQANAARNYFAALSVGASSTMQNIAKPDLLATPIAVPIDSEVAGIVAYLDAKTTEIDSLIDAKQQMADKLREYRRSLISEAVTGKFKVPGIDSLGKKGAACHT